MKNRLVSGIVFLALGLLIALGPQTIFPVCRITDSGEEVTKTASEKNKDMSEHNMGNMKGTTSMKCHWTARAELGVGLLIAFEGFLLTLFDSRQTRFGLNAAIGLSGILSLLFPTILTGVCGSTRMDCRSLTLPALVIISVSVIVCSVMNGINLYKKDRIGGRPYGPKTSDHQAAVKE